MTTDINSKALESAARILRLAVPQMSALDIAVTPENYTVWYEYFAGTNLDLNRAIDGLLANRVDFSSDVNASLYKNFIQAHAPEVIENVQVETQMLINHLLQKITDISQNTNTFSGTLQNFSDKLQLKPDAVLLNQLVEEVSSEVDMLLQTNQNMAQSLSAMDREMQHLKADMANLSLAAMTDQLTSLHNRRAYELAIEEHIQRAEEQQTPCCLLLVDIDHFKLFNDTHGHLIGDKVLAYIALALKQCVRGDDFVARYGGEEFTILLPNTEYADARLVAETLRGRIAGKHLTLGKEKKLALGPVTVSIGIASLKMGDDIETLFARADGALYLAKSAGRNCVRG